jgi:hypothetical protein
MVILEVPGREPSQMALVPDDPVLQTPAAETPNHAFDRGVLPRTLGGSDHCCDPHVPHPLPKRGAGDPVSVPPEKTRRLVPREGVHDWLRRPRGRGMLGDVDMDNPPAVMDQDQQDE